jgi:hypothetical protein
LQKLRFERDGMRYAKRKFTKKMSFEAALEAGNAYGERMTKRALARINAEKDQEDQED